MDSKEFIEKCIEIEEIRQFDKELFIKKEKLKKYIYYLDLIEYEYFRKYLYICYNMPYIWKGYISSVLKKQQAYRYTVNMYAEGFIEQIDNDEEIIQFLINRCNLSRYHAENTLLYRITDKGKSFFELEDVENYLNNNIDDNFKKDIQQDLNEMFM